jgi:hypothetical protein
MKPRQDTKDILYRLDQQVRLLSHASSNSMTDAWISYVEGREAWRSELTQARNWARKTVDAISEVLDEGLV